MKNENLGEDIPKEQVRVREVLGYYKKAGPQGAFAAMMIEDTLKKADQAAISGDVVAMLAAYQQLKEIEV